MENAGEGQGEDRGEGRGEGVLQGAEDEEAAKAEIGVGVRLCNRARE